MIKPILFPLTVLLLTSSSSSVLPKRIDLGSSIGYFSNFTINPFNWKEKYLLQVKYTIWSNGSHRLSIYWDSDTAFFEKNGGMYQYVPLQGEVVSGVAGQEFSYDINVQGKFVCHENTVTFEDYDLLSGTTFSKSVSLIEKKNMTNRNLGTAGTLLGDTYIDVGSTSQFTNRQPAVDISNYKESIESDARGILPLDRMKLDFYDSNGHKAMDEEDDNLSLIISGDDFMDFEGLIGHGGTLSEDEKSIKVPLKWKKDGDGYRWPIMDESVFGYDLGNGAEAYSETLKLPKKLGKYPIYHCRIENDSTNLGSYYYEFDVEKGTDYFGSCRNSSWCVEVS